MAQQIDGKKSFNINGKVTNLRMGVTKEKQTPFANFTLLHDNPGKDGQQKKTCVDAYGATVEAMKAAGLAEEGAHVRVWGLFKNEKRMNKTTNKEFNLAVLRAITVERPLAKEEIEAKRQAKAERLAAEEPAAA